MIIKFIKNWPSKKGTCACNKAAIYLFQFLANPTSYERYKLLIS